MTALNRYLGPDNIECTGVPEQGRSGGGLFNGEGELIGVCIAADPKEQRGLYAGLKAVQGLLEEAGLSRLYRHDAVAATERASQGGHSEPERDNRSESPGAVQLVAGEPSNLPKDAGRFEPAAPQTAAVEEASADLSVLSEAQEAEVICIIRPLNSPRSASRVVIINRASPRFVSYLKGEIESQPRPTTVKRPIEIEDSSAAVKTRDAKASTIDGGGNRPAQWRPARPERASIEPVSRVIQRYRRSPASR